jgi:hypothetical protein
LTGANLKELLEAELLESRSEWQFKYWSVSAQITANKKYRQ